MLRGERIIILEKATDLSQSERKQLPRGIRSFDDGIELLVLSLETAGFNASISFFRSPMVCLRSTMIWISSSFVYSSYWAASSTPQLYHIFLTFSIPTPE